MKRNLERRFSPFDLLLVLALVAVLVVNIAISGRLPDPGMRKASREAVTATGTGAGKVGDVVVEVTADKSNLYSVKVLEQNETPGIGSLAVEQLPAAMVEANSVAVDSISSATVTSEAIKAAVCAALTEAGFNPADFGYVEPTPAPTPEPTPEPTPKPETAPAEPADGVQTATGTGTGIDGNVVVEVKADANTIYEVNVLEQNETPGIGSVAVEKLPGAMVEANSIEVDGISGATVTSTAIKTAVTEALTSMGFDPAAYQGAAAEPADGVQTATGTGTGIDGNVVVEVKADANTIYEVNVLEQNETPGIGSVAVEKLPGAMVEANSIEVDGISGATVTSTAIKTAVAEALTSMGFDPAAYQGAAAEPAAPAASAAPASPASEGSGAMKVQTMSGVTVMHAADWKEQFPEQYNSWMMTRESSEAEDYLEIYPMLRTLYEGYGFAKDYKAARGHYYDVQDIEATGRPHPLANCWTCKTPDFTNMVNEEGISAYQKDWSEVQAQITEGISCYTCHANNPGPITVTHTYWIDAVGDDFDKIAPANLACGQCHNEYYFAPDTKATTIAHNSLASMAPETMLAYFNDGANFPNGEPFADWTNPRTGVKQIKVQHPEFETFLGAGSPHANTFTCADCHMPVETRADGSTYHSHNLISPLDNPALLENTCSVCHKDLASEVRGVQQKVETRTYEVGYELEYLTELLAQAVESGKYTDEDLAEIRQLARDSQFYWDFVFVENAEGVHNPSLTYDCLDRADALCGEATQLLFALTR